MARTKTGKALVFVAYSYSLYNTKDFRKVFSDIARRYDVQFVFADESFTKQHIFAKIRSQISGADFALFDVSDWNPNVTLELGLADGLGKDYYILFNPSKSQERGKGSEVPSDIKGLDRIQFDGFEDLKAKLGLLISQKFRPKPQSLEEFESHIRNLIIDALKKKEKNGITVEELRKSLNIDGSIIRSTLTKLADKVRHNGGATRSRRYYYVKRTYKKRR